MNVWRLKGCNRCGGDLFAQEDEWGCIQCGRYYYPDADMSLAHPRFTVAALDGENDNRGKRRRSGGLPGRNINAVVRSQLASTQRRREQNQQLTSRFDAGRTVAETA